MRHLKIKNIGFIALAAGFCFLIAAGCVTTRKTPPPAAAQAPVRLKPGPNDGHIAYWTAKLLETYHYSQERLDAEISGKFFDGYVNTLDASHEYFLQSDLAEFAHYRTNLDTLTLGRRDTADLTPAFAIFQRFLERFTQRAAYVDELLQQDKFKFNTDEHILLDRSHAPYPKDLDEARQLWRQSLRSEYLQEKLSREISPTNGSVNLNLPKSATDEIIGTLAKHNRLTLQMVTNSDSDNVLSFYLNALAHAYDPHSDYLNNEHAADFSISMSLSLFGIGAQLNEEDGYCKIGSLIHGGPADKSKQLKESDYIVAVAQSNQPPVDVVGMEIGKVVQLIRGPKGTQVRLTIRPADDRGARRVVTLIRDEIKLEDQEAKARLIEMPDRHGGTNRIGVIDVPSFYAPVDLSGNAGHSNQSFVSVDVAKLIKKLEQEKVAGIILDLRRNPGGSLEEAIRFTGLFIKDGPVVLARNPEGRVSVDSDDDSGMLYDGPLVVLVNRFSASASEIAAAALQDYGRALVVGDTSTFGKGTVQNLDPLYPTFVRPATASETLPGTVKITIRKFYRITGASTQFKGVVPDIILSDTLSYRKDAMSERTLENALPFDTLEPDVMQQVTYSKLNLVQPHLALLRERSDARVATNQDFIYIRQDIGQSQELQADKSATLNEREALKQREAHQAMINAHEQEREMRKAPDEKNYDIAVENVNEPGLTLATNSVFNLAATGTNSNAMPKLPIVSNDVIENQRAEDARLQETENILEDYISMLSKSNMLIASHPDL